MSGPVAAQRGIALMLVLWVLALLTIIAVGLTATQRTETTLAGNQLATAHFRATAQAGVSYAILNLLAPATVLEEEADVWIPDGMPRPWRFEDESLQIQVFNEASRIDLNVAGRDLLIALTSALELPENESNALADAIEDWRDDDDFTQLNGAEDSDYEAAGRSYGAKDGPFDSVEELQLVLGMNSQLYRALLPALTVDSGDTDVEREFANPLVQAAVQGITLAEAELALEEQQALIEGGGKEAVSLNRGGPLYRIRVTRMVDEEQGLSMEALVLIEPGSKPPFSLLWQRFGLVAEPNAASVQGEEAESGEWRN